MMDRATRGWREWLVIAAAVVVALVSARRYAGGWNDGTRLATVEALVDHGTFAIDDSIFVHVPPDGRPYPASDQMLRISGTNDKLFIGGHYYTDKPPVPAVLLAAVYWVAQRCTGLNARDDTALFCWFLTVVNSGLAFIATIGGWRRIARLVRLPDAFALELPILFAVGTVAVCYCRVVNAHILLLAIATLMLEAMLRWPVAPLRRLLWLGTLGGFAYTTDYGAGPTVLAGLCGWVLFRCWSLGGWRKRLLGTSIFALAALPWLAAHHGINYAIGGMFGPLNTNPNYFRWPNCPFSPENLSGGWNHPSAASFLLYGLDMLVGKRGILGNNFLLYLSLAALPLLLRRRVPERPELATGLGWAIFIVLGFAISSNNYSGNSVSIRWFLPLLAPGFLALAVLMRERLEFRTDCRILAAWTLPWVAGCWITGPWWRPPVVLLWLLMAGGMTHWLRHRTKQRTVSTQPWVGALRYCSRIAQIALPESRFGRLRRTAPGERSDDSSVDNKTGPRLRNGGRQPIHQLRASISVAKSE